MSRPTPETDALISVGLENADRECVPADFARKLERERDEARGDCKNSRQSLGFAIQSLGFAIQVLDEAKAKIKSQADRIRYLEGATNHASGTPLKIALRQRDEAVEEVRRLKAILDLLKKEAQ